MTLACERCYKRLFTKACMGCKQFSLKERRNVIFLNKIDLPYGLVCILCCLSASQAVLKRFPRVSAIFSGNTKIALTRRKLSFFDTVLLCRLHTDTFPQSVVILGGRLRRARITWVRGPTLAALSELRCMYRSRIR